MFRRALILCCAVLFASLSMAQSPIEGVLQDLAANEAQRAIGRLVENICPTGQISDQRLQSRCNEIVGNAFEGNADGVRHSLQALAPEENLVVGSSMIDPSVAQVDVVQQRLATIRAGAASGTSFALNLGGWQRTDDSLPAGYSAHRAWPALGALNVEPTQDAIADDVITVDGRWGFFANGTASSSDRDPTSRVSGFESDLTGLTAGVDYRVTSHFVIGGAIGYEENESDLDLGGGSVDNETMTLSFQTSWFSGETSWVEAIIGLGQSDIDQSRAIQYRLPGVVVDSIATGSTESDQLFASFATGWDFASGAWAFSPEIRFDYQSSDVDGFAESVDGSDRGLGLGIVYDDQDFTSLTGEIGVQIGYNVSTSFGVVVPQINAAYVREFEDGADSVQGRFLGDSLREFYTLLTDEADDSYARAGAGAVFVFKGGKSFYVFYDQLIGHDFLDMQTFNVGLRLGL